MNTRPVRNDELDDWHRMRCALFPEYPPESLRREMDAILSHAPREVCLAAVAGDGRLIGFAEGNLRDYAEGCESRPVGYLEAWYVDPDVRRQGVGRALVDACLEWARGHGCTEFASDCDLENDLSLKAHLALGFTEVNRVIQFRRVL